MVKRFFIIFVFSLSLVLTVGGSNIPPRQLKNFDQGWRFHLGDIDSVSVISSAFSDLSWRLLNLPHDWAIEGNFDKNNPSGTGGGALPGGLGWYRKTFQPDINMKGKVVYLRFDGVYMNSDAYINGKHIGFYPNGYTSFEYDITPYLIYGKNNVIAVKVDNRKQPNSRWYSGCGIYRHVWLTAVNPIHIETWGTYVTTQVQKSGKADVNVKVSLKNSYAKGTSVQLVSVLKDKSGVIVAKNTYKQQLNGAKITCCNPYLEVNNPDLWTLENPHLYTLNTKILQSNRIIDEYTTVIGIRTFQFDAKEGFSLNGKPTKINGVCLHHDLGCLGSAVNKRAIERQLQLLKDMGCNGIRCSHNPPDPELLNLCDSMGFVVMDEAFDMWRRKKSKYDYANYFDKWYEKDLTSLIVRDRNHPSIFMWSIGNEVLESSGVKPMRIHSTWNRPILF